MFDGAQFGKEIVTVVKTYVDRALEPVLKRLDALEADIQRRLDEATFDLVDTTSVEIMLQALSKPENGKDADPEIMAQMVEESVQRVLAGWEQPKNGIDGKDGKDGAPGSDGAPGADGIDGKDGRDGADGEAGAPGRNGINGEDGIGVTSALQDKDGNLILTLSDGRTTNIGRVQGIDGHDGLGFDDMTEVLDDDGRTIVRRYTRGDQVKEFRHTFAVVLDRGIWKESVYQSGDGVSWGGRYYIAQRETSAQPNTPAANGHWRRAVDKGRDGKDGIVRSIPDKPIVKVVK